MSRKNCLFKISLLWLGLFYQQLLWAQSPTVIHVHFDKPFYAVGEMMWYKIYFLSPEVPPRQVVYVDIVDADGERVSHQKLLSSQRIAFGDFEVPLNLAEGYYQFYVYTLNQAEGVVSQVFSQKIPIFNEFEGEVSLPEQGKINADTSTLIPDMEVATSGFSIQLDTDRVTYKKGDSVSLTVQIKTNSTYNPKANLSVAVVDLDVISAHFWKGFTPSSEMKVSSSSVIADSTLALHAKLIAPIDGNPVSSRFISVFLSQTGVFLNTEVDEGILSLSLPEFYEQQTAQFFNLNPYQQSFPKVVLEEQPRPASDQVRQAPPSRTPAIERYLYLSSLRRKLSEMYEVPMAYFPKNPIPSKKYDADQTFLMEKYQLIEDIETLIDRQLFKSRIKGEGLDKTVRLYNNERHEYFEEAPWYLVDGVFTRDEAKVLAMPLKEIDRVEFFYKRKTIVQQFAPLMFRTGVLAIYTKQGNYLADVVKDYRNIVALEGLYPTHTFVSPEAVGNNFPDFRPLVFWKPDLMSNEKGKASLSFVSSQAIGHFLIVVEGVTADGKFVRTYTTYQTTHD